MDRGHVDRGIVKNVYCQVTGFDYAIAILTLF